MQCGHDMPPPTPTMQEVSNAVIAAEQRIGELLLAIPKASGGDRKSEDFKNPNGGNFEKTKSETIKDMGYGKNEAHDYQQMAKHPEGVAFRPWTDINRHEAA